MDPTKPKPLDAVKAYPVTPPKDGFKWEWDGKAWIEVPDTDEWPAAIEPTQITGTN